MPIFNEGRPFLKPSCCLHLYVNSAKPGDISASGQEGQWTLPLPQLREFLEITDLKLSCGYALIDGYEPALAKKLPELIGYLRLYGWEPILATAGLFPTLIENPEQKIKSLVNAGLFRIHLEVDEKTLKAAGIKAISLLYREAAKNSLSITSLYNSSEDAEISDDSLRALWQDPYFNNMSHLFYVYPGKEDLPGQEAQENDFDFEFIIGNRGTIVCWKNGQPLSKRCSLLEKQWQKTVAEWLNSFQESSHASV